MTDKLGLKDNEGLFRDKCICTLYSFEIMKGYSETNASAHYRVSPSTTYFWMDFHLLQLFQQKDFKYRCCIFYIIILQKKTWTKAMPRLCTFYRFQLANLIILCAEYPSNRNRFLAKIYKRLEYFSWNLFQWMFWW